MTYLNLDDNYPDHPKIEALSDAAYRLHGSAMFYAARFQLDGYLTVGQLRARNRWSKRTEAELLDGLLLHPLGQGCGTRTCPPGAPDHYLLHDFLQWNKSREWWDEKRRKDAERLAEWRAKRSTETGGKHDG